jgi:ArsR family transcriptional regulator
MLSTTISDPARTARWFHALADETRLEILRLLSEGERCVCDLTEALEAAQSRLSFHLKTLKTAGIVSDRREGRWVYYSINPEVLDAMADVVGELKPVEGGLQRSARCCE